MSGEKYVELSRLIREYDEVKTVIRADNSLIISYPKSFVMSTASTFEYKLIESLSEFVDDFPDKIETEYPEIDKLNKKSGIRTVGSKMYKKLIASDNSDGTIIQNAEPFYQLFGGDVFKDRVKEKFELEKADRIANETKQVERLNGLSEDNEGYLEDFVRHDDIKNGLEKCTFEMAEQAFLDLKLKRNRLAHNYLHGLSDSFEDVRKIYYDAVLYAIAIENAIGDLTREFSE